MCDYSLEHVQSRPAEVGDKLVSTRFFSAITRGFASPEKPDVAVCLLPGTEVAFDDDVTYEPSFGFFPVRRIRDRVARFRQVDIDQPAAHHDALEFANGLIVKVSRLCEGQRLTVLQLPAHPASHEASTEAKEERTATEPLLNPL